MAQYTYTPIPPNTIRVLHLHPGPPDSPLRGRLAPYPLPQATTATAANDLPASNYDCVSYVWGGDEKLHTIFLSDNGPLPITATLHSLLRRLRKQFSDSGDNDPRPLPVWADAICINQDDAIEKGLQVGLMPAIYRGARRVVVDLGEESEDLDDALWLMSTWWKKHIWSGVVLEALEIARPITPREAGMLLGFEVPDAKEREALEGVELPDETDPRWDAVARFFDRPWFARLWVVQEFVLAREVVMICGEREIPWREAVAATIDTLLGARFLPARAGLAMSMLRRVPFQLMAYQRQVKVLLQTAEGREILRVRGDTPNGDYALGLYSLLGTFLASKATWRRDRYFALMGVAEDVKGDEPELRPDYVSPIETVVSRVGSWLWKNGHGPAILLTGGLLQQSGIKVPSWVPDFAALSGSSLLGRGFTSSKRYKAAGDTRFHFTITPEASRFVTLSALLVDAVDRDPFAELPLQNLIQHPSDGLDGKSYTQLLLQHVACNLRAVFDDVASASPVPVEISDNAVTSALVFGAETGPDYMTAKERAIGFRWMSWLAAHKDVADNMGDAPFEALSRSLEREFKATTDEVESCQWAFLNPVIAAALGSPQLTRTRRGRVANLPSCFRRGDEIWVVRGLPLPLLLRKSADYPGCYRLVGSCYVHGIMDGEALTQGPKFEQLTLC